MPDPAVVKRHQAATRAAVLQALQGAPWTTGYSGSTVWHAEYVQFHPDGRSGYSQATIHPNQKKPFFPAGVQATTPFEISDGGVVRFQAGNFERTRTFGLLRESGREVWAAMAFRDMDGGRRSYRHVAGTKLPKHYRISQHVVTDIQLSHSLTTLAANPQLRCEADVTVDINVSQRDYRDDKRQTWRVSCEVSRKSGRTMLTFAGCGRERMREAMDCWWGQGRWKAFNLKTRSALSGTFSPMLGFDEDRPEVLVAPGGSSYWRARWTRTMSPPPSSAGSAANP